MTWPAQYGGGEKSNFARLVVTEELLAAGAPVSAHWIATAKVGPCFAFWQSSNANNIFQA